MIWDILKKKHLFYFWYFENGIKRNLFGLSRNDFEIEIKRKYSVFVKNKIKRNVFGVFEMILRMKLK